MICKYCHAKIPDHSVYCPCCGSYVQSADKEKKGRGQVQSGTGKRTFVLLVIILLLLAAIGSFIFFKFFLQQDQDSSKEGPQTAVSDFYEKEQISIKKKHENLQSKIRSYIQSEGINDTVSVYYKDLNDGIEFECYSRSMRAAQSGRIFVLEYIAQTIESGDMSSSQELLDTIKTTATGDEPSSRRMVEMITGNFAQGLDLVSQYVKQKGYHHTIINRFNGDIGNHTTTMPNQTSAKDTGKSMACLFDMAEQGNDFAKDVLEILAGNASSKRGIPEAELIKDKKIQSSNFSASYTECENDTAVLICGKNKVVLSIMITELTDRDIEHSQAVRNLQEISNLVAGALL